MIYCFHLNKKKKMFKPCLTIFLFLSIISISQNQVSDTVLAKKHIAIAKNKVDQNKPYEAIDNYLEAAKIYEAIVSNYTTGNKGIIEKIYLGKGIEICIGEP